MSRVGYALLVAAHENTMLAHSHSLLSLMKAFKEFPTSKEERATFINVKTKRIITPFQYQVYDLCAQVPLLLTAFLHDKGYSS